MTELLVDARCLDHPGLGRYVRQVLGAAVRAGLGPTAIVPRAAAATDVRALEVPTISARAALYAPLEQVEVPLIIRRLRPRLVHFPHFNAPLVVPAPFLVTIHDLSYFAGNRSGGGGRLRRLAASIVYRRAARKARAIITATEAMKTEIVARLGVAPARVTVIPHAVDPAIVAEPGPEGGALLARLGIAPADRPSPVLLYVGSWQPRKNIPALVAAFARLRAAGRALRLVLAGKVTARERAAVRAAAGDLLDDPGIAIAGEVTDGELGALYRAATMLVYPSSYEGFGLPVAEALAVGVPVVAGDCPAVAEVAAGAARLVPDPTSADALAAAMAELLDAPALRARQADLGRRRAAVLEAAADGTAYRDLVGRCVHMH